MSNQTTNRILIILSTLGFLNTGMAFARENPPSPVPEVPETEVISDFAFDMAQREAFEMATKDYIAVAPDVIRRLTLKELSHNFVDPNSIVSNLSSFTPGTSVKYEGLIPNDEPINGRTLDVSRVYSFSNGELLILTESDYVAAGQTVTHEPEMVNTEINGIPATLTRRQAPDGAGFSMLTWITNKKVYSFIQTELYTGLRHRPNSSLLHFAKKVVEVQ